MTDSANRRMAALSAYDVDPLSWFTGPLVPLVFAALNLVYGSTLAIITWIQVGNPRLQFAGVLLCTLACLFVQIMTQPMRRRIGWKVGAIAVGTGSLGLLISALGYTNIVFSLELWWAPFGVALVLASLAPYLPARTLILLGSASIAVTAPFAYFIVRNDAPTWGPLSTVLIITSPIVTGIVATAVFSYVVVSRMQPLIEKRSQSLVSSEVVHTDDVAAAERVRLAELTARAVPFLEGIIASGVVSSTDRALAGQMARRLRDDLVTQSNLSWLDSVASGSRLVVIDPERRAGKMRTTQRTALRALLQAILDTPGTDAGSLLVELRGAEDGSTAVGVSLDMELPEGRRIMHLAPYYLTLSTAVKDLQWSRDRFLKLSFNLPD
ncbi:MAG TPA: hypothetical protein VGO65_06145 [Pseudolysinimonas sp.]|nr:hypothetical protein [Pseudolysinimonas sp.]